MKYGSSLSPAARIEFINTIMRELDLSPVEALAILDMTTEEGDSWLKAQNSKLVKVLE